MSFNLIRNYIGLVVIGSYVFMNFYAYSMDGSICNYELFSGTAQVGPHSIFGNFESGQELPDLLTPGSSVLSVDNTTTSPDLFQIEELVTFDSPDQFYFAMKEVLQGHLWNDRVIGPGTSASRVSCDFIQGRFLDVSMNIQNDQDRSPLFELMKDAKLSGCIEVEANIRVSVEYLFNNSFELHEERKISLFRALEIFYSRLPNSKNFQKKAQVILRIILLLQRSTSLELSGMYLEALNSVKAVGNYRFATKLSYMLANHFLIRKNDPLLSLRYHYQVIEFGENAHQGENEKAADILTTMYKARWEIKWIEQQYPHLKKQSKEMRRELKNKFLNEGSVEHCS